MLDESQEEKNYSVNWVNLFIKIIIFAVLLLLLIWVVSLFSTKKCQTTQTDYYVVSYFSKEQYTTNYTNNTYTYRYTIELEDITTKNSKDVSLLSSNYFHTDAEYSSYLKTSTPNYQVINDSTTGNLVTNIDDFMDSSLKTDNFDFTVSDIYEYENNYYFDITINVSELPTLNTSSDIYYVPIHLIVKSTSTSGCKQ